MGGNYLADKGILNLLKPLIKQRYHLNKHLMTTDPAFQAKHKQIAMARVKFLKNENSKDSRTV